MYVHYFDNMDQDLNDRNDLQHWPDIWTDVSITEQHLLHRQGCLLGMQLCQMYLKDEIDHHQLR